MNILVVCPSWCFYEKDLHWSFVYAQAREYIRLGHQVRVVSALAMGKQSYDGRRFFPAIRRWTVEGVEVYELRYFSLSHFGQKMGLNRFARNFALRKSLETILDGFRPDVIHGHITVSCADISIYLKGILHCPLVLTDHGEPPADKYLREHPAVHQQIIEHVDCVVSVSSFIQKNFLKAGVCAANRVIFNGFHAEHIRNGIDRPPVSLLQGGRMIESKKADITCQAFALILKQHPEASLTFVGGGPFEDIVKGVCKELEITSSVRLMGDQPNMKMLAQMSKSQFFVMPAVQEGFGIVYLEAMASGCITVGTENEGISDVIVSGENGFLAPPNNPEAIAKIVEWCLENPEEAAAIAERGRRTAMKFTWQENARQYITLFEELIG